MRTTDPRLSTRHHELISFVICENNKDCNQQAGLQTDMTVWHGIKTEVDRQLWMIRHISRDTLLSDVEVPSDK